MKYEDFRYRKVSITYVVYQILLGMMYSCMIVSFFFILDFTFSRELYSTFGFWGNFLRFWMFSMIGFPLCIVACFFRNAESTTKANQKLIHKAICKIYSMPEFKIDYSCTVKTSLFVDIEHGKAAIISWYNPFEIQVIDSIRLLEMEMIVQDRRRVDTISRGVKVIFTVGYETIVVDTLVLGNGRNMSNASHSEYVYAIEEAKKMMDMIKASAQNSRKFTVSEE